jgi:SAM-dependent methyltransferase
MKKATLLFPVCLSLIATHCCTAMEQQNTIQQDTGLERNTIIYNTDCDSFQKYLKWSDVKAKAAEALLSVISDKKDSLLDIGAGNGMLTQRLESKFNHITAVEPSLQLFEFLKSNCCSDKYTLINLPIEETRLEKKFDVILASHSLKFIPNPEKVIAQIKNLLNDSGTFLLVDHGQESDYLKFYYTYRPYVFGKSETESIFIDYTDLLSKSFNVKKVIFYATLSIPSIDEAISMLDFFYDIEFKKIRSESLVDIRQALDKEYGNGRVNISLQEIVYICSK